jgi:hypothetical protein
LKVTTNNSGTGAIYDRNSLLYLTVYQNIRELIALQLMPIGEKKEINAFDL